MIDLHVHSNASDGKFSPEDIIKFAIKSDITTISLTEHYNLGSYKRAKKVANGKIEVIPGIEIGATLEDIGLSKNHVCHILAYFPSYNICKILDEYELSRDKCVRNTIDKLQKYFYITYSDVKRYARNKNSIGRFDIAIAMANLGYSEDPTSAYGDFLDTSKSFYVTRQKMTPKELLPKIRKCHGVPVLAHPKSLKMNNSDTKEFISLLKGYGLEGIEAYNAHNDKEQRSFYAKLAKEFDLAITVGSDFHGGKRTNPVKIGYGIDNNLMISDTNIITDLKDRHHKIISS